MAASGGDLLDLQVRRGRADALFMALRPSARDPTRDCGLVAARAAARARAAVKHWGLQAVLQRRTAHLNRFRDPTTPALY